MTGDGGKLTAKPEWPLWLDWLDARLRPGTRDQGSHPRRRAFRRAGYSGGGDHSFPTARARLQAAIQQAREQWAARRIRVHSHIPGAAPELLNVDPDDRLNTTCRRTRNQLRLPGERTDRLAIRIEDVPEAAASMPATTCG